MSNIIYIEDEISKKLFSRKMPETKLIIAVDGPSGAGKGTVSKYLSEKFNLKYLDTGLIYRTLAAQLIETNTKTDDIYAIEELAKKLDIADIQRDDLRREEIAAIASKVAAYPTVRLILNELQRTFAYSDATPYNGVILDGRDIGTVICPDADCKIFLTACPETRAKRRTKETTQKNTDPKQIQDMMSERDQRDSSRKTAPLTAAADACVIDTTNLTIDELCETAAYYIEKICFSQKAG